MVYLFRTITTSPGGQLRDRVSSRDRADTQGAGRSQWGVMASRVGIASSSSRGREPAGARGLRFRGLPPAAISFAEGNGLRISITPARNEANRGWTVSGQSCARRRGTKPTGKRAEREAGAWVACESGALYRAERTQWGVVCGPPVLGRAAFGGRRGALCARAPGRGTKPIRATSGRADNASPLSFRCGRTTRC